MLGDIKSRISQFIEKEKQQRDVLAFIIETVRIRIFSFPSSLILLSYCLIFSVVLQISLKKRLLKGCSGAEEHFSSLHYRLHYHLQFSFQLFHTYIDVLSARTSANNQIMGYIIATASLNTLIPKDRSRTSTEQYTIKEVIR